MSASGYPQIVDKPPRDTKFIRWIEYDAGEGWEGYVEFQPQKRSVHRCVVCGKWYPLGWREGTRARFCSRKCYLQNKQDRKALGLKGIIARCMGCRKWFAASSTYNNYCSEECAASYRKEKAAAFKEFHSHA